MKTIFIHPWTATALLGLVVACGASERRAPAATSGSGGASASAGETSSTGGGASSAGGGGASSEMGGSAGASGSAGGAGDGKAGDAGSGGVAIAVVTNQIAAGYRHTCVIRPDKHALCWGEDATLRQLNEHFAGLLPSTLEQIAAADDRTCAIRTDKELDCANGTSPVAAAETVKGLALSGTGTSACAIKVDGSVACTADVDNVPSGKFTYIAGGPSAYCGIREDKQAACWGESPYEPPAGELLTLDAGGDGSAGGLSLDGHSLYWGSNSGGALAVAERYVQVSLGMDFACGLRTDGTVQCLSSSVMIRGEDSVDAPYDVKIPSLTGTFVEISAGPFHVCGLRDSGKVACAGSNLAGQSAPPAELN